MYNDDIEKNIEVGVHIVLSSSSPYILAFIFFFFSPPNSVQFFVILFSEIVAKCMFISNLSLSCCYFLLLLSEMFLGVSFSSPDSNSRILSLRCVQTHFFSLQSLTYLLGKN